MSAEIKKRPPRKRRWRQFSDDREIHLGAYIVPNLFTTANLFSGFFGIISSINGKFEMAGVAILISAVFDILDGKVARLTRATSRFGVEYDSQADLVAFGVGPGILMYLWALKPFGRLGWLAAFLFVACGALRLARFNVQTEETATKKYFTGLPIPGAAIMVGTTVLFCHEWDVSSFYAVNVAFLLMTYFLGFLMVSTVPFNSFKEVEMMKAKPLPVLFGAVTLLSVIAVNPHSMLFLLSVIYVASGPLGYVFLHRRIKRNEVKPEAAVQSSEEAGSADENVQTPQQ